MRRPPEDRTKLDLEKYEVTRELKRRARPFEWTKEKAEACVALAEGATIVKAAARAGVSTFTIEAWRSKPEFASEVDKLTFMTGLALPAHRVRLAKQFIDQQIEQDGTIRSKRDILDWLRFIDDTQKELRNLLTALHRDVLDHAGPGDQELVLGQGDGSRGTVEGQISDLNEETGDASATDRLDDPRDG
jgi:hypothetical protein